MRKSFGNSGRSSGRDSGFRESNRSGGFNRERNNSTPREMHKTKCADCGKECEVPFKPTEGRPVYCKECYGKHKPQRSRY